MCIEAIHIAACQPFFQYWKCYLPVVVSGVKLFFTHSHCRTSGWKKGTRPHGIITRPLVDEGREDLNTTISGASSARQPNAILYFCDFSRGVQTPCPPSLDLHMYTQTPYSHGIHILTVNHYSSINESPHHLSAFYICK